MTNKLINSSRRLFALVLSVIMVITAMPMSVFSVDEGEYIEVRTVEDLYNVRLDLTANYVLMNDIDLTEATAEGGEWDFYGNGWNPIGSGDIYSNNAFSGTFDGNGHKIIGLRIDITSLPSGTSYVYAGLFSNVTGTVKNLTIDGNIYYNRDNPFDIGSVSGTCNGTIENCINHANIKGVDSTAHRGSVWLGGKYYTDIGYAGGITGSAGTCNISKCANTGNITSYCINNTGDLFSTDENRAGGIVGNSTTKNTIITKCYNTGKISARSSSNYDGEDTGHADAYGISYQGTLTDCYNAGEIEAISCSAYNTTGTHAFGIGYNVTVTNCYNVGKVTGITHNYAIHQTSTAKNCYYLAGTGTSSTGATSLTEAQMMLQSMYAGFDFENTWMINTYANHPYPQLRNNIQDLSEAVETVRIISLPEKTEYIEGDELELTGGMYDIIYISGRSEALDFTPDVISGYDPSVIGEQTVSVTVGGVSDTFTVTVEKAPAPLAMLVSSMPDKTSFVIGSEFDLTGAKISIAYNNGTTREFDVTKDMVSGYNMNHLGRQTVTVTYLGFTESFEIEVLPVKVDRIEITKMPEKTEYLEGEEFDSTGLEVTAFYTDGREVKAASGFELSGYDSTPGEKTVSVNYLGKNTEFKVNVTAKKATSIEIVSAPAKTEYYEEESLDLTGLTVKATYDNGETAIITDYIVTADLTSAGLKTVMLTYQGVSAYFAIKVSVRSVVSLTLASLPYKTVFIEGEEFDTTGLSVIAQYNNGTEEEITDYSLVGFVNTPGTYNVLVNYGGKSASFSVTVLAKVLSDIKFTYPKKTYYNIGEEFDPTGFEVFAIYSNGERISIDSYTMKGFDTETPGIKEIEISFGGITRSFNISVAEKEPVFTNGKIEIDDAKTRRGETVSVPVSVTKNPGIAGFRHVINFDENNFEFVEIVLAVEFAAGQLIINDEKADEGEITVVWFATEDTAVDGELYSINLFVKESAPFGKSDISISFEDFDNTNIADDNLIFIPAGGKVDVLSYWLGDLTGDRKYKMADLLMLAKYVAGITMTLNENQRLAADVNEDGSIDIHDVVMLQQWILYAE